MGNRYQRVSHLLLVVSHLPVNTIPPTTTPIDSAVFEQPEVLNTTPIVDFAGGQPLQLSNRLLIFTNSFPRGYLRVET